MPLSLVALAAAASFVCADPTHHDGDNMRCSNVAGALRLQGIDAPEMPGACRPGRACVDGDPFAARDTLRGLTAGRDVQCVVEDTDVYGRSIVNCTADGVNISCAMIAAGQAIPRYAPLDCSDGPAAAPVTELAEAESAAPPVPSTEPAPVIVPAGTPTAAPARGALTHPVLPALVVLLLANAFTWLLFALDKRRARAGRSRERIAESTLLGWAALGGSPSAWWAMHALKHKSAKDSFKLRLLLISGVQAGIAIGAVWWLAS